MLLQQVITMQSLILAKDDVKHDYKENMKRALDLVQEAIKISGKKMFNRVIFSPINVSFSSI